MSSALVPVYTRARTEDGEESAWNFIRTLITTLSLVFALLVMLGCFFSDSLVRLYAPAFSLFPGKHELTVALTQCLWFFLPLVILAAVWMGVLNARGRFGAPAFASSVFNFGSIFGALVLCPLATRWGFHPIFGMAAATLLGGLGQWLMQMPSLRREGFSFRFRLRWREKRLREVFWLMGAGSFGLAATQINILINSMLATGTGPGAVSWLHYAFRLLQFPIGVFGVAISTATLTKVSLELGEENRLAAAISVRDSLRALFVLSLPSSVGLAVLGKPIISLIYERGEFTAMDTKATAAALAAYALGLSAYGATKILVPVFYSLRRSGIAILASALSLLCNTILCFIFVKPLGFVGLPLATSISSILSCAALFILLAKILHEVDFGDLARCFAAALFSSLIMGGVLLWTLNRLSLPLFLNLVCGIATYAICAKVLRLREFTRLNEFIWKQIHIRRNQQ